MKIPVIGTVEYEIEKESTTGVKPRLLLHACCGPCSAGVLYNIAEYFDITIFFYNPNIMPKEEFIRRLEALKAVIAHFENIKLIIPEQSEDEYLAKVKGMESIPEGGARCSVCFEMRLDATARYLAEHSDDYDFFATTLTVSPMKNAALINEIGNSIADKYSVKYLFSDFKKRDGYLHSIQLCKEWNIYRQHYCGCTLRVLES